MKSIVIIAFCLQCCNIVYGMDAKMNGNKGETTTNTEQVGSKPPDDTYSTWAQAAPAWDVQPFLLQIIIIEAQKNHGKVQ